jgi:hypothetical protein
MRFDLFYEAAPPPWLGLPGSAPYAELLVKFELSERSGH